jgi:hypothetical protein
VEDGQRKFSSSEGGPGSYAKWLVAITGKFALSQTAPFENLDFWQDFEAGRGGQSKCQDGAPGLKWVA